VDVEVGPALGSLVRWAARARQRPGEWRLVSARQIGDAAALVRTAPGV